MTWLGRERVQLDVCGSTSDEALRRAREGAPHGLVVVADAQTAGRGRAGRTWHSPPGANLYVSALLRLDLPPSAAPPLTLAAGVAACDAVRASGVHALLKWPNDVLASQKKLAGVLTESSTRGMKLEAVVVGIGIDVNGGFPPELAGIATSMKAELGRDVDRTLVLEALLASLERWVDTYVAMGPGPVVEAWKQRSGMLGRRVAVVLDGRPLEGRAQDLDGEGALLVEDDAGRTHRVLSGEIR